MDLRGVVFDYGGVLTDPGDSLGYGEPPLFRVVRAARRVGVRAGLLSNAGAGQADPAWAELFDAVVLYGEVGVAKPDVEIYRLTARRLGLAPGECVFVDDLPSNVAGAVDAGMVGIRHESVASTADELEVLFRCALLS